MAEYAELIRALQHCSEADDACATCQRWMAHDEWGIKCKGRLISDAAAAIEELQADIKACRTLSKCRLQGWKESELFCEEQAKTLESVDVLNKSYLERIRKLEQKLPHWVSVDTALPETFKFVLVCNDENRYGVAQYVGDDGLAPWQIAYCLYDVDIWDDKEQGPIRYWMPLPEPPQEVQE